MSHDTPTTEPARRTSAAIPILDALAKLCVAVAVLCVPLAFLGAMDAAFVLAVLACAGAM